MVLENVKEMWTETPKLSNGKKGRPVNKDRFISKMYALFIIYYGLVPMQLTDILQVFKRRFGYSGTAQLEELEGKSPYNQGH